MIARDENNKWIGGVCAGIAKHFQAQSQDVTETISVELVRLIFCFSALLTGFVPMAILYVILWAIMPKGE